jgi:pyridine nucleotide-disulfide oxidoreductase family protein
MNLILIGGGHSHAIALRLFALNPIPGVRLTLITDVAKTPYSGMLPGHVAGFYSYEETHIDLLRLASFAGAEVILDKAIGLDLDNNLVICEGRSPLTPLNKKGDLDRISVEFDYLSIDIGSTPARNSIFGDNSDIIPAKPVPEFLKAWEQLIDRVTQQPESSMTIAIVGGGAGGVELALNMQSRLRSPNPLNKGAKRDRFPSFKKEAKEDRVPSLIRGARGDLSIHLFHKGDRLLSSYSDRVSQQLERILQQREIKIHLKETVREVSVDRVICESGLEIKVDRVFWVTQASAPNWIKESGLRTDEKGFILVNDYLQSVSHPHIFAAGDIANMENYSRPKAGVFAVRQGKPLFTNWQRIITNQPLQAYIPQKKYLSLIGTGDRKAIATWGELSWRSRLFWYGKDYIDRQFMNLFGD